MRVLFLLPVLLLSACGSRQTAQQTTEPSAQPTAGQAAPPTLSQPAPPPASAPVPLPAGRSALAESAPTVAEQAPPAVAQATPAPPPAYSQPAPSVMWIPAGTVWRVRLEETLDTRHNRPGDRFSASLIAPIRVDGTVVVPRGTYCSGHLAASKPSGRLKGRALMSLSLDSFDLNGTRYYIRAAHVSRQSGRHKKRNLVLIGGGSGSGAAIGAIAGGPIGALIGAGAGGAAGLAGAAITGKKNVRLPVETTLDFYQRVPVSI